MRTCYGPEEYEDYLGGRDLLVRRCAAWAQADARAFDPMVAEALLDSRHFSPDGRLGYWTPGEVRRALLRWIPGKVTAPDDMLLPAPETLRTLLRYMDARGLRDPRGATLAVIEQAIDEAASQLPAAIADKTRFGMAKTMMMLAQDSGVDITDSRSLEAFMSELQAGQRELPDEVLNQASQTLAEPRALPQLPVWLPAAEELIAATERSKVATQLRAFVRWLEPAGRALTSTGNIKPADARELSTLLGTGEEHQTFRSAAELYGLNLIVTWAKKARLVRKQGGKLVPVAKSRPLLDDAEALWQRAFEAAFDLGEAVIRPWWTGEPPSPVSQFYDDIAPDLLNTIYSMPEPLPVSRMVEPVWENIETCFALDELSEAGKSVLRARVDREVNLILDVFEALGAVTSTHGMAHEMFSSDLDEDLRPGLAFTDAQARTLRKRLKTPDRLVALSPLGTQAVRQRLLAEGRDAPLVGELVGASAAEMLGIVAESYSEQAGADEIARWRDVHGGSLEPLVAAIRDCRFLSRQSALLATLAHTVPEGDGLLTDLLADPELGPVALATLRAGISPEEAGEDEAPWLMVANVLQLLEAGGPERAREMLAELPRAARNGLIHAVLESEFPAAETMAEFRDQVAQPLLHPNRPVQSLPDRTIRHQRRRQPKRHRRHR